MTTLAEAFASFRYSAFRLETLPDYEVPEEAEELEAYEAGQAQPERSVRTSPWLANIAATVAEGRDWRRLRLITDPPTFYERWELERYLESQACGEQVRLVGRDDHPTLADQDFWLFDGGTAAAVAFAMDYGPVGEFRGASPVEDLAPLEQVVEVWCEAQPLNNYLATPRTTPQPDGVQ